MLRETRILLIGLALFVFSMRGQDPHPDPIADFEVSNLCFGSVTNFSNTSTIFLASPVSYFWTVWQMGLSTPIYTSSAVNINFQFPVKTTYTVSLGVINYVTAFDFHSDEANRVIVMDSVPVANFDFQLCHSRFANLSCCTNSYLWDFGDGSPASTLTNPVHTYTTFNTFTVTLIASNGVINDTVVREVTPLANILTGGFDVKYDGDTIRFKSVDDSLKGSFCDWEWNFGDGSGLDMYGTDGWKTKHYYKRAERDSIYKVFLSVKDHCYEDHTERYVLIKGTGLTRTYVYPSPVINGDLNIESNEKEDLTEIRVVDCLGKQLDNIVPTETQYGYYIYMGTLPSGIYLVQLVFKGRVENHKILKQ